MTCAAWAGTLDPAVMRKLVAVFSWFGSVLVLGGKLPHHLERDEAS